MRSCGGKAVSCRVLDPRTPRYLATKAEPFQLAKAVHRDDVVGISAKSSRLSGKLLNPLGLRLCICNLGSVAMVPPQMWEELLV